MSQTVHLLREFPKTAKSVVGENIRTVLQRSGHLRRPTQLGTLRERQALFYGDVPKTPRYAKLEPLPLSVPRGDAATDGNLPAWILRYTERDAGRWQYVVPDLVYTPEGLARLHRAIEPDLSSRVPVGGTHALKRLLARPAETLNQGTIIEREHPNTYGDFCSEDLKPLVLANRVLAPVIFPAEFRNRPYLHHDMDRLGLPYRFSDRTLLIEQALVLRKTQSLNTWSEAEVQEYRRRLGLGGKAPARGSLLYLSRKNVRSSRIGGTHQIDSAKVEVAVTALGGQVVDTEGMRFEDFLKLASEAETVVADHGAAMFNLLLWQPLQVVEIVPDDWWSPCFVILSQHLKVRRHVTLSSSLYSLEQLRHRLSSLLADA